MPEIQKQLGEFHPHYAKSEDCCYFIVLTQTCDLVRRETNACKAMYISLAAVLPFSLLMEQQLSVIQRSDREKRLRYASEEHKDRMHDFLERLLNNNEPGHFYLHEDHTIGFEKSMVAYLSLSVAVKADPYYSICLDARVIGMMEIFQAKLGWLVGNLYSRVGTPDWVPDTVNQAGFESMIGAHLDQLCSWFPKRYLDKISKEEKRLKQSKKEEEKQSEDASYLMTIDDLQSLVQYLETQEKQRKEQIISRIQEKVTELDSQFTKSFGRKLTIELRNDPVFSQLVGKG
ncbi:MAG: hypothetical protein HY692_01065 [Cyanobacteria bacterium NC_groundwater_1444_Ag_S-0.65um_54_12]|nr:hypothetical protein [Cyanobacteria bacterium NC_groundwater_1444_Ag_S-0.65um_54_12]